MTSPPAWVLRLPQVLKLIEFLMNRTAPSQNRTLTPPGWRLRAASVWLLMVAVSLIQGACRARSLTQKPTSGARLLGASRVETMYVDVSSFQILALRSSTDVPVESLFGEVVWSSSIMARVPLVPSV